MTVYRQDTSDFEDISSEDLVPGDIIVIPSHGCEMHCDAVLVSGSVIGEQHIVAKLDPNIK